MSEAPAATKVVEAAGARPREWRRMLDLGARIFVAVAIVWLVLHVPAGRPWPWDGAAFDAFDDVTLVAVLGFVALGAALTWKGEHLAALVLRAPRWTLDVALAAIAVLLVHHVSMVAFHGVAQVQDEIAYDRLARRFAVGHPVPAADPLSEFFRIRFQVDDARSYPLFQPGWPIVLAVGYVLRAPTFAPAFATAALVVAGSRLAERMFGRLTGLLAGVVLLCSGFVVWIGASYFAHALAAALYALAIERAIAATEPGLDRRVALRRAIVGGLAAAWLVLTRLPTAAALLVPLVVILVARAREELRDAREARAVREANVSSGPWWRRLGRGRLAPIVVAYAAAAMLGPLGQLGWDLATTGHALELPQDRYFALTESNPRCHRLGFGDDIGCGREHPGEVPPDGFGPRRALEVDRIRWETFRTDAFGSALPLALVALFVLRRGDGERRRLPRTGLIAAAVLAPIAIYTGFYYHAVQHGTRLWTECMGPLAVAIAAAIAAPFESSQAAGAASPRRRMREWASRVASGVALLVLGVCACRELLVRTPERAAENGKNPQAPRVKQNLASAHVPAHSLVFLHNCIEPDRNELVYGWAQVLDALPPSKGDWWLARDFGPEHDRQLLTEYPDWHPVRATCDGQPIAFPAATPSPRDVVTELEAKFPLEHRGAYPSVVGAETASNQMLLSIHVQSAGGVVGFPQHLFVGGQWDVSLAFARRLDGGRFVVVVDGVALQPPVDGGGPVERRSWSASAPIALDAGDHRIELRSIAATGGYTNDVDRLELHARK